VKNDVLRPLRWQTQLTNNASPSDLLEEENKENILNLWIVSIPHTQRISSFRAILRLNNVRIDKNSLPCGLDYSSVQTRRISEGKALQKQECKFKGWIYVVDVDVSCHIKTVSFIPRAIQLCQHLYHKEGWYHGIIQWLQGSNFHFKSLNLNDDVNQACCLPCGFRMKLKES